MVSEIKKSPKNDHSYRVSSRNGKSQKRGEHLPRDRSDHDRQHSNEKLVSFSFKNWNVKDVLSDCLADICAEKNGAARFEDDREDARRFHRNCFWTDSRSERVRDVIWADRESENESD